MFRKNNDAFVVQLPDKEMLYAVGNVTAGFPFLAETDKGKLVTPFYLDDGVSLGMLSGKGIHFPASKKEIYEVPEVVASLKNLRVPTVALNLSKEKYGTIVELSSKFPNIPKLTKPSGDVTVFLPIVAFEEEAIRLHKEVSKGDTIIIFGELKETLIKSLSKTIVAVWAVDIRKDRTARRNLTGAIVE